MYSLADGSLQTYTVPFNIGSMNQSDYYWIKDLVRWGDNGLAVRTERGVYVVRSDLFKATQ